MSITAKASIVAVCGIGCAVLVFLGLLFYVDGQLQDRSFEGIYRDGKKIWATRGLVTEGVKRNSIASVRNAFARGARGTEVDVFFDRELGQFVVSHSRHYRVKQRELLTLERLFDETAKGTPYFFWLDWKKLRHLSRGEVRRAALRLDEIASDELKSRIYIEGGDPINLSVLRNAGFQTIFDIYPLRERFPFWSVLIHGYKIVYYFGGFSVISMDYGEPGDPIYGPGIAEALGDIPVFLYHVPDETDVLEALYASPSVRVILINQHSTRFETM